MSQKNLLLINIRIHTFLSEDSNLYYTYSHPGIFIRGFESLFHINRTNSSNSSLFKDQKNVSFLAFRHLREKQVKIQYTDIHYNQSYQTINQNYSDGENFFFVSEVIPVDKEALRL